MMRARLAGWDNTETHQLPDDLRLEGGPGAGDGPLGPRHGGGGRPLRVVPGGAGEAAGASPGQQPPHLVHLPGVLLVVEYLLVSPTWPVLHVGQRSNPARHFKLQLFVVNLNSQTVISRLLVTVAVYMYYLNVSTPSLVFEIFS